MKYFKETTVWSNPYIINGEYYLTDDRQWMIAYRAPGHSDYKQFKTPIRIEKRGRQFKVIGAGEQDSVYIMPTTRQVTEQVTDQVTDQSTIHTQYSQSTNSVQVAGSKGAKYLVTRTSSSITCDCPGFVFRKKCRHIEESIKLFDSISQ